MKIHKFILQNFRCFRHLEIEFDSQFNVLIGENGSGKTAVIDGLRRVLSAFFLGIDDNSPVPFRERDVRLNQNLDLQFPVSLGCEVEYGKSLYKWAISQENKKLTTNYDKANDAKKLAESLQDIVRKDEKNETTTILPILLGYSSARIWTSRLTSEKYAAYRKGSRLRGYNGGMSPVINQLFFVEWWKNMELAALQHKEDYYELTLIQKALSTCIDSYKNMYFDFALGEIIVEINSNQKMAYTQLSDGYRGLVTLISDIAFRCILLNGPILKNDALKTPGIVLIDEIDLHLHPSWQISVAQNLIKTFPYIQFIVSTHSPLILSTAKGKILSLEEGGIIEKTHLYGRDVNSILTLEMDSAIRSEEVQKDWDNYLLLIEKGQGFSLPARALREKLSLIWGEDYPELAKADAILSFYEVEKS